MKKFLCILVLAYLITIFSCSVFAVNENSEDYSVGYEDGWIDGYSEAESEYEDDYADGHYNGYSEGYDDANDEYKLKIEDGELITKEKIDNKQNDYTLYVILFVLLILITTIAYILYTKKKAKKDTVLGIFLTGLFIICLFAAYEVYHETIPSSVSKLILCSTATISFVLAHTYWRKFSERLDSDYKPSNIKSHLYHKLNFTNKKIEEDKDIVKLYINNCIEKQYAYEKESNRASFSFVGAFDNYINKKIDNNCDFFQKNFYCHYDNFYYTTCQNPDTGDLLTIHFNDKFVINNIHAEFTTCQLSEITTLESQLTFFYEVLDIITK